MQTKLILIIILGAIALILAIQNPSTITLKFLIWHFPNLSLVAVIIASALIGAICGLMIGLSGKSKKKKTSDAKKKKEPEDEPQEEEKEEV